MIQPINTPQQLPRLVMRRAAGVAAAVLALALLLGLVRMRQDMDDEVESAVTLARLVAALGPLGAVGSPLPADDLAAVQALHALQQVNPPRHLLLRVAAADGRLLLGPPPEPAAGPLLAALLALHQRLLPAPEARQGVWLLPRPGGLPWTVTLSASHESERREALVNLLGTLALLLLCVAGLLLVMRWNLGRALAPLQRLLAAIGGIERHELAAVRALPPMPVGELEAVAAALRHLATALDEADARRRGLGRQVQTLQEDERARLARELHDEFGQRLTALRVDAAWLARRVGDDAALRPVIDGMADQCRRIQQDIRTLLARLQPFGPAVAGPDEAPRSGEPLDGLAGALRRLVTEGSSGGRDGLARCQLLLQWRADVQGAAVEWPAAGSPPANLALPTDLALAIYRISQEAMTNVARHARATEATLRLLLTGPLQAGAPLRIDWSCCDDGVGLPSGTVASAFARGNGLAGIRERVWALGGDLHLAAVHTQAHPNPALDAQPGRPGLRLSATLCTHWLAVPADETP